jgi:hypothetical protein
MWRDALTSYSSINSVSEHYECREAFENASRPGSVLKFKLEEVRPAHCTASR